MVAAAATSKIIDEVDMSASESEYDEEIEQYAGADNSYDALPVEEDAFDEIDTANIVDGKTRHRELIWGEQPEEEETEQEDPTFQLDAQMF